MNESLSPNTQAILLLTAPLIMGRQQGSTEVLTPGEYKRLAHRLVELHRQPADLAGAQSAETIALCADAIDAERLRRLLGRGFLLSQAVDRWHARAIKVISRADPNYPAKLKTRLKDNAPAVLYGCGEWAALDLGGLAVVGSRDADDELIEYTLAVGRLAAQARCAIISGGARGIDQAAMRGALEAGGTAVGILADGLEQAVLNRDYRQALLDQRLTLVSPYDPLAGFNVGNAMQRNKLIYALSDTALVVNSDYQKGGTWAGAIEQLDKLKLVPVFIRASGKLNRGMLELRAKGAFPWSEPASADAFATALTALNPTAAEPPAQVELSFAAQEHLIPLFEAAPESAYAATPSSPTKEDALSPSDELFAKVRELLLRLLTTPMREDEIATALGVTSPQARQWLTRLVDEGALLKEGKPTRYSARAVDLFSGNVTDS